jgi:hypothetical protein
MLITRRAYGFRTPEALIALAMLSLGGLCPLLPEWPPETAEGPHLYPRSGVASAKDDADRRPLFNVVATVVRRIMSTSHRAKRASPDAGPVPGVQNRRNA